MRSWANPNEPGSQNRYRDTFGPLGFEPSDIAAILENRPSAAGGFHGVCATCHANAPSMTIQSSVGGLPYGPGVSFQLDPTHDMRTMPNIFLHRFQWFYSATASHSTVPVMNPATGCVNATSQDLTSSEFPTPTFGPVRRRRLAVISIRAFKTATIRNDLQRRRMLPIRTLSLMLIRARTSGTRPKNVPLGIR